MKLTPEQTFNLLLLAAGGLISLVSGIVGAVINTWFTSRREHRRWLLDQKRIEYRELLDGLHECMQQMSGAFLPIGVTTPSSDPDNAMRRGYSLIRGRIFTAPALAKFEIERRWKELCARVNETCLPKSRPTAVSFNLEAGRFEDELTNFIREDLEIGQ